MDINEAIDRFYFPLSATQFIELGKEFGTSFRSNVNNVLDNNDGVDLDVNVNIDAKIRIYLMIRGKNGNIFINVVASKLVYATNPSVNSIRISLDPDNNTIFNTAFVLGTNAHLVDAGNTERSVQYMANIINPSGPFSLFIVMLPSRTLQEMIDNHIENVRIMRLEGQRVNIASLDVVANIRVTQSARPINDVPQNDNLGSTRDQISNDEFYGTNLDITRDEVTAEDMGESINAIGRQENVVNAVDPEDELEIVLSTTPNTASISDVANIIADLLSAEVTSKGWDPVPFNYFPMDYFPIDGSYYDPIVPKLISGGYNLGKSLIGIILPRISVRYNGRYNYYAILSIIGGLSVFPLSILYWYTDLIKRDLQVTTEFMQSVLKDKVEINSTQDVVDQYIKYVEDTPKLSQNDKDLLTPLLKNTVVYHSQEGVSYISIPETMQSLDDNGVKLEPYFPEKYVSNLPTPVLSYSGKFSPSANKIVSPSASMKPSASPRFTPSEADNFGNNYLPTTVEDTLNVVTEQLSSIAPATWVGSVLPILGTLISNGLSVLTGITTAGISIFSYIVIGALAVGAYFLSRK